MSSRTSNECSLDIVTSCRICNNYGYMICIATMIATCRNIVVVNIMPVPTLNIMVNDVIFLEAGESGYYNVHRNPPLNYAVNRP